MPKRFGINLPNETQRFEILEILLKGVDVENRPKLLKRVAATTSNLSGSELKVFKFPSTALVYSVFRNFVETQ